MTASFRSSVLTHCVIICVVYYFLTIFFYFQAFFPVSFFLWSYSIFSSSSSSSSSSYKSFFILCPSLSLFLFLLPPFLLLLVLIFVLVLLILSFFYVLLCLHFSFFFFLTSIIVISMFFLLLPEYPFFNSVTILTSPNFIFRFSPFPCQYQHKARYQVHTSVLTTYHCHDYAQFCRQTNLQQMPGVQMNWNTSTLSEALQCAEASVGVGLASQNCKPVLLNRCETTAR